MLALLESLRSTIKLFGSQRKLWLPFLAVAVVEAFFIALVWLAPHLPFSKVLAPPVRYFAGDRVLHYPWHLWFLYHAMKHTHLAAATLVGAFFTGIACAMVRQTHEGQPLSLRQALISRQVRYGRVFLLWVITWGLAKGLIELLTHLAPENLWAFWGGIGGTVLLQAVLAYAIPAAVFDGLTWWRAALRSVREFARHPLSTLVVIGIPSAAVILFALGLPASRVGEWMMRTTPEVVLVCVAARLIVWTVADSLLTVSIAHLWWFHINFASQNLSTEHPTLKREGHKREPWASARGRRSVVAEGA